MAPGELTIQLMEDGGEPLESRAGFMDPAVSDYLHHYLNATPQVGPDTHGVFLNRYLNIGFGVVDLGLWVQFWV